MRKTILVIDMPECCGACPCYYDDFLLCKVTKKENENWDETKPNWCPLKPLPINENDIENAQRYSQLINGIIDRMVEEIGRVNNE